MVLQQATYPTCVLNSTIYSTGSVVEISYDPTAKEIVYNVNVTSGTYVAVGYGTSMTDTDMCFWNGNGASSIQEDLYATGESTPAVDSVNAYTSNSTVTLTGTSWTSTRPIAATGQDTYVIPVDYQFPMISAYYNSTNLTFHHGNHFNFDVTLLSTGGCTFASVTPPT